MTEHEYRLLINRLLKKEGDSLQSRLSDVKELTERYVEDTGNAPPHHLTDKLTDYLVSDELKDMSPYKTQVSAYPILSRSQWDMRKQREVSLDRISDASTLDVTFHAPVTLDEAIRESVSKETRHYRALNAKQPVKTYNLRNDLGDAAFEARYPPSEKPRALFRDERHAEWSLDVRRRDGFTCQKCGQCSRRGMQAHHIESFNSAFELRYDVSNGVTLCISCHSDFHYIYGKGNNTRSQLTEWMGDFYYEFQTAV
ncbi:HNH endonuclease [Paenibacillus xylanilyticus]|uniref:HNH endonuclease n=1 Tax=Paenibacillus xylanilyticus TaxID=248903 RepID=UPI003AAA8FB1